MKKRLLSVLLTLSMVLTLLPVSAFAVDTKDLRDTEFHIMDISGLKQLVAKQSNVDAEDVTIHGVYVNGTQPNGKPGTATGNVTEYYIKDRTGFGSTGDVGLMGSNGRLAKDLNIWKVLNASAIIDPASVSSITVYARTDVNQLGHRGTNLSPVTIYLDKGDIILPIEGKLITQIHLKNASLEPPVETEYSYTVNYFWVDEQENVTPSTTVDSVTKDTISQQSIFDSVKKASDLEGYTAGTNYVLDTEKSSKDFTWTRDNQVFEVFYAVDANKDGTPDYREKTYTLFYNPNGAAGTITDSNQYYAGNSAALESGATLGTENDGIVFLGWTQGENGHTASNPAKQKPTDVTLLQGYVTFVDKDITVCAAWAKDTNNDNKPDYENTPEELGWPINVSFCDPSGATIGTMQVIKKDEQAIPPEENGDREITGWTLDPDGQNKYDGLFTYSALAKLVDNANGWNEYYEEGYLTLYAVYAEESETVTVTVKFVDVVTGKQVGDTYTMEVPADANQINISKIPSEQIPSGYEVAEQGDVNIDNGIATVKVRRIAPTDADLKGLLGNLQVDCYTEGHEPITTGLLDDSYTVTGDGLGVQGDYYYIQLNTAPYVAAYSTYPEVHTCVSATMTIALYHDGNKWIVPDDPMVLLNCESTTPTEKQVTVKFVDVVTGKQVGDTYTMEVPADANQINTSEIPPKQIPSGYEVAEQGDVNIDNGIATVKVRRIAPTDDELKAYLWNLQVDCYTEGHEPITTGLLDDSYTVTGDGLGVQGDVYVIQLNTEPYVQKYIEDGYSQEHTSVSGDTMLLYLTHDGIKWIAPENPTVMLNCESTTPTEKQVTLNFYDEVNNVQVKEDVISVPYDAIHVNTGDMTLPEGYEFIKTGDLEIVDGYVYVAVKPIETPETTVIMNIRFVLADGTFVGGGDYFLPEGVQNLSILEQYVPVGYEMAETGDFMVTDGGSRDVRVEKLDDTVIMNIRFVLADGTFVGGGDYFLPEGIQNMSILEEYVPEGYKMMESGDFFVTEGGQEDVTVEKIAKDVIMNIRFVTVDGEFIAGGDYFLPEGIQNMSILEQYVPEGYKMMESGDFFVTEGGQEDITVEKINKDVIMKIRFVLADGTFIAGGDYFLPEGIQNMSILEEYVPEGYKMMESGDFFVTEGGQEDITVEKITESDTQSVTVTYWDTTNDEQVGESFIIAVAADATNLNTSVLTNVPEGYELVWTGDLAVENGAVRVEVRPVTTPPVEKTFTVTFDSNGGSAVVSQTVEEGAKAVKPANPTRSGYTFDGWYLDDKEYSFDTPVSSDITLTAKWTKNEPVNPDPEPEPEIADISVWKSVSDRYAEVEDTIWYSIRVKNTGDVRLFDVTVDDEMMGNDDRDIGTLDPGESWEDSYSYKVRSSDEGDTLVNEVYVTAETWDGSEVTAWDQVKTEIDEDDDRPRPPRPDPDDDKDDEDDKEDEEPEEVAEPEREYEPAYLNTEDHYAYITGYSDGTVRPLNDITRAEVATIFFRLLTDEARETYWSTISGYSDVSAGDWYNNAVSTLSNMGVIGGYPDGTFGPNDTISRAEFVAIATRFFDYTARYEGAFSDVSSAAWYADYIQAGVELGLVAGYPDGTFDPDGAISRAEACAIVNRVLGRVPHADYLLGWSVMVVWEDNQNTNAWYYADIQEATNSHDFQWIEEDGETVESWTEKLEERDWSALEEF